jgi:peptidoglycan hydrolase CwlO-like protein
MNFIKNHWKLILLGVGVVLVVCAIAFGGTGYKVMKDWIASDINANLKQVQSQVDQLNQERDSYLKQISKLQDERTRLNGDYQKLKDKYAALETQMANISVPTDPDALVMAFRNKGFKSAVLLRSK